ncbi:MAG: hypothetical protein AABZ60_02625 [Planctomycetota bacterium]
MAETTTTTTTTGKSDRVMLLILGMGILAGFSFFFLAFQYQRYKKISKGIEVGLTQLPKIYELDQAIKEKQSENPQVVINAEEAPPPSTLINFFTSQIFVEQSLEQLKTQCLFDIMPAVKISDKENEENISIQFKQVNRADLVKYVFSVEKAKAFIKLKEVEMKAPPKQEEDVWDAKLIFAYRRMKMP